MKEVALFNIMVGNRDAKDDNNRSVWLKVKKGEKKFPNLRHFENDKGNLIAGVEYQSDIGNALGDMFAGGDISSLKGEDLFKLQTGPGGKKYIQIIEAFLYVASSMNTIEASKWIRPTEGWVAIMEPFLFGDLSVMEPKNLAKTELGKILNSTKWPHYMKLATINRLTERTRGLLKVMNEVGYQIFDPRHNEIRYEQTKAFTPSYTLSEDKLKDFAREVDIDPRNLRRYIGANLLKNGLLNKDESDTLTKNLVRTLEIERFPSGLHWRVSRMVDHKNQSYVNGIIPKATLNDVFSRPTDAQLDAIEVAAKESRPSKQGFQALRQGLKQGLNCKSIFSH